MSIRILSVAVAVSVLGLVAAPHQRSRLEDADLCLMQGQWERSCEVHSAPKQRVCVDGSTLTTWKHGQMVGQWKIRLAASRSPRTFDAIPLGGGERLFGIYEFSGHELRLRWATRRDVSSMVAYVIVQSTDRPRWRHRSSKAFSSSSVSRSHSSMKFSRDVLTNCLPGFSGGWKSGS